jgi:16S rRNA (cytidine1402-2'-O)-methyltransferase
MTLYLVATPIGNLADITLRALDVLRDVRLVAAEDTRSARVLLQRHSIEARVTSYNDHNRVAKTPILLEELREGDVALISDAGMPGISDPGHDLVRAAIDAGHTVTPIPGPSAVIAAVAASGLPSRRFHYLGFLPRQSRARRSALTRAGASGDTIVVFESPHRLRATLEDAVAALGDRSVAVARELTKVHEEIWRGTLTEAMSHFARPRGEFTLVIEGGGTSKGEDTVDVDAAVRALRARGATAKDAVAELVRVCGVPRRAAYAAWHRDS